MIQSQRKILPIFLVSILVILTITVTFFSSIVTVYAELEEISEKTELPSSKTTEDTDVSDQSTIEQQKDALTDNFSTYEGLRIKLENFNPWTIFAKSDKSTCYNIDLCFIHLGISNWTNMLQTWIIEDSIKSQTIKEYCKCNTLEGYVSYIYKNTLSQFDNFSLINEDQIILSTNISAIQLEYEFTLADTKVHAFTIFTENNGSFYQLNYYANSGSFSNYLSNFKTIIDTIDFLNKK